MGLVLIGLLVLAAIAGTFAMLVVLRALLWLVLLPVRIVFYAVAGILFLPLLILKFVIGGVLFALVLPVMLIGLVIAAIAAVVGLAVPLLPMLAIGFLVWALMRSSSTTAIART